MADREAQQKLYAYGEMSNKVQQANRSSLASRRRDGTGEVETLWGRKDVGRMGDKVSGGGGGDDDDTPSTAAATAKSGTKSKKKERPVELQEKLERASKKRKQREEATGATTKMEANVILSNGGRSILEMGDLTGYQPTHAKSRSSYESLLSMIKSKAYLGNQATDIITDAANEIIATLKDESLRDPDRHLQISQLLTGKSPNKGGMSREQFATVVSWGKGMDDYNTTTSDAATKKQEMDEEMGVAVVFDDSDEEEEDRALANDESEGEEDEVVEVASTSSSEPEMDNEPLEDDADEERLVQGDTDGGPSKKRRHAYDRTLTVHEIDAHYLQRQLSSHYEDATVCADIAREVLEILDLSKKPKPNDLRDCENLLLGLLESELFDFIKLILNNRVRIWACVSLKRAKDNEERVQIENILKVAFTL